jgi:methionyl-tRNA synthetase
MCNSVLPGAKEFAGGEVTEALSDTIDVEFARDINALLDEYREAMEATKLRSGLSIAMQMSARGNVYIQRSGLDKSLLTEHPERCAQVLLNTINLIYLLSVVIHPFMPTTSEGILRQLNAPARSLPETFSIDILPGHTIGKAEYLFKRIDNVNGEQEKKWQRKFGGDAVAAKTVNPAGPIGHPEGGAVPKVKKVAEAGSRNAEKKAKAEAADENKSAEEKELEEKMKVQSKLVADVKTGKQEGDLEKEMGIAKAQKTELAELKRIRKLAEMSIQ